MIKNSSSNFTNIKALIKGFVNVILFLVYWQILFLIFILISKMILDNKEISVGMSNILVAIPLLIIVLISYMYKHKMYLKLNSVDSQK